MGNVWWVNQKGADEDVLWAPLKGGAGQTVPHWDALRDVRVGDTVIHHVKQQIVAVSEVTSDPEPRKYPFVADSAGEANTDGIFVDLARTDLTGRIRKDEIPLDIRKRASTGSAGGPFQADGENAKQGYLYPVEAELWDWLTGLSAELAGPVSSVDDPPAGDVIGARETDAASSVKARKEQAWLRQRHLQGRPEATCGICGQVRPERYLHLAHIKRRADATDAERWDENIGMLACLFGCDQAFECGDLRVAEDGVIRLGDPTDPFVEASFGALAGSTAPAYHEGNAAYFAARDASFPRPTE